MRTRTLLIQTLRVHVPGSCALLVVALLSLSRVASAQETTPLPTAQQDSSTDAVQPPSTTDTVPPPSVGGGASTAANDVDDTGKVGDRIFGVLPNYTTVEGATRITPVSTAQMFHMAAADSFDKPVFPFVAFTTWLAGVQGEEASWGRGPAGYSKRYVTTFSDDVMATFLTTGIMPSLLHQDPRYFQLGQGRALHRVGYAATRSFVTLSRSGHSQFNFSDVTGNAIAATASNLYHPAEDRTAAATAARWGTQMMWDILSSELKEFWPDIRHKIRRS